MIIQKYVGSDAAAPATADAATGRDGTGWDRRDGRDGTGADGTGWDGTNQTRRDGMGRDGKGGTGRDGRDGRDRMRHNNYVLINRCLKKKSQLILLAIRN